MPRYPSGVSFNNLSLVPMSFDHRVGLFTAALAVLTALVAGVAPAWRQSSAASERMLRALAHLREGLSGRVARAILAVEVTIATVIVAGTALVGVSAWRFLNQPLGFEPAHRAECLGP